jgi:hypothetical protein
MSEKNYMINILPTHFFLGFIMKHNPYQIIQIGQLTLVNQMFTNVSKLLGNETNMCLMNSSLQAFSSMFAN